jgi:FdhD protein
MVHVGGGGELRAQPDHVALEEPLEIRLETPEETSVPMVTMRTPGHDVELVAGWLLAEGVVETVEDIAQISYCVDAAAGGDQRFNVVTANLRRAARVNGRERRTVTSSACGVCATASIEALRAVGLPPMGEGPHMTLPALVALPDVLREGQRTFEATGSVHAAALVDGAGACLVAREDVGRHNAVDKAVGWALLSGRIPLRDAALVVSGRISFEIVQKTARAGIGMVVAVSGATSLAVSLAEEVGITLVGFVRGERCVVYSRPDRVLVG